MTKKKITTSGFQSIKTPSHIMRKVWCDKKSLIELLNRKDSMKPSVSSDEPTGDKVSLPDNVAKLQLRGQSFTVMRQ